MLLSAKSSTFPPFSLFINTYMFLLVNAVMSHDNSAGKARVCGLDDRDSIVTRTDFERIFDVSIPALLKMQLF